MTEKLTQIHLPGSLASGQADWGEKTVAEMIAQYRANAATWLKDAQDVLAAADADFRVTVVRGSIVQHPVKTLQQGRPEPLSRARLRID